MFSIYGLDGEQGLGFARSLWHPFMTKLSSEKIFPGSLTRTRKRSQVRVLKVSFFFSESASFFFIHTWADKTKAQKEEEKDKAAKADDPKAGAGVGKIVTLISDDSNKVRNIICFSRLLPSNFTFLDLRYGNHALFFLRRYI